VKRGTEAWLDTLAEAAEETEGEIEAVCVVTLEVSESRIGELATYCAIAAPKTIEHGRVTWRETSGRFRGIVVTLKTKERRITRRVAA
jgi:hypothetical protein